QCGRAGMRQQRLAGTDPVLQPGVTLLREGTVSRKMTFGMRLTDVPQLLAGHVGLVEWNTHRVVPAFVPTTSKDPPAGNDTPSWISARSRSMTLSRTAFAARPILNSSRGSNSPAISRLRSRATAKRGRSKETKDETCVTVNP